ncbi:hypothetical protein ACIREB_28165 [Streptomyces anulatus]|uniref:hypothetical protein n=1 Tax=Streptomyces sp. W4I9-2 TaxID=3042297 RepID=UPI002789B7B0|nr:hypothetical protein [Streptomyces sp. W4I9-2]MDQ0693773.1 hypothetical protein [Streptomyces sp. W4I9-2]
MPCNVCHGGRYNQQTLDITLDGLNIADVLRLTVDEAAHKARGTGTECRYRGPCGLHGAGREAPPGYQPAFTAL